MRISDWSSDVCSSDLRPTLKLQPGALFTRDALGEDVNRIRQALLAKNFLSPTLNEPRVERNPETNEISIEVTGSPGPLVNIRSEERRVGKACVRTCKSRCSRCHYNKKNKKQLT